MAEAAAPRVSVPSVRMPAPLKGIISNHFEIVSGTPGAFEGGIALSFVALVVIGLATALGIYIHKKRKAKLCAGGDTTKC